MVDKIGGLSSGIDTAGIIEKIISDKSKIKNKLEDNLESLDLKKQANMQVNTQLLEFKNIALNLKLEQTFLSKITTYSNSDSIDVSATADAITGSYNYEISQLAEEARASSFYNNIKIVTALGNTTGITSLSGAPLDTMEGTRKIEIFNGTSSKLIGSSAESNNYAGMIGTSIISGVNDQLNLTINSTNISITLNSATADLTSLSVVGADLKSKINAAMNTALGTSGQTYVDVEVVDGTGTGNGYFKIIDMKKGYSNTISVTGGTAQAALGFNTTWLEYGQDAYAKITFTPHNSGVFKQVISNGNVESLTVRGKIRNSLSGGTLSFNYGTDAVSVTLNDFTANTTDLLTIAKDMEDKINAKLNEINDTTDMTYIKVDVQEIAGAGNDKFIISNAIAGNAKEISSFSGTAASVLGLDSGTTNQTSSTLVRTVTNITSAGTDSNLTGLKTLINDSVKGLLAGVQFNGTLTEGQMTVVTDASLNLQMRIKETVTGNTVSTGNGLSLNAVGLQNAGFLKAVSSNTNGYFTINDKKITISDYTQISVNDLLGMINSSGAGVTASYDSSQDKILIQANDYSSSIKLGASGDTSNIFDILRVSSTEGGVKTKGSTLGTIDPSAKLASANFFIPPVSGTFSINGVSIYVDVYKDTLNDVLAKINNSAANVTAYYSAGDDKVYIQSNGKNVATNTNKIKLGGKNDTSNFLMSLNLVESIYTTIEGKAQQGNLLGDTFQVIKGNNTYNITIPATNGTGAYNQNALTVNFTNGIASGAKFDIYAGSDGTKLYHWENTSSNTITDIDTFIAEWNKGGVGGNWTSEGNYSDVAVKAVKEGTNKIRFFNASGGALATFTIIEKTSGDAAELGLTSGFTYSYGVSNFANSEYNALNLAYEINKANVGISATTDSNGKITISDADGVNDQLITLRDVSGNRSIIKNVFGDSIVTSTKSAQEVGKRGKDAIFKINGQEYTRTNNKVTDVISNVTITLKSITTKIENFTITNDTDKTLKELSKFIASYNGLVKLLNPSQIPKTEQKYLKKLTDKEKANMTYTQIEEYEAKYKLYNQQQIISRDLTLKGLLNSLKEITFSSVKGINGNYDTLASIGLQTKNISTGLDDYKKGYLFMDSTDKDEIYKELKNNSTLKDALSNNARNVYNIFANKAYSGSGTSVLSSTAISPTTGITIPPGGGDIKFTVSDGYNTSGQIILKAGQTYTQKEIAELFDNAGFQVVGSDKSPNTLNIQMGFQNNKIGLTIKKLNTYDSTNYTNIYIKDLSSGSNNLNSVFGIEAENNETEGLARQWDKLANNYIGLNGIIKSRIKSAGLFDQEADKLQKNIDSWDKRLDTLRENLWKQFNKMEEALSKMQSQSAYFSAQIASLTGANNSSK